MKLDKMLAIEQTWKSFFDNLEVVFQWFSFGMHETKTKIKKTERSVFPSKNEIMNTAGNKKETIQYISLRWDSLV